MIGAALKYSQVNATMKLSRRLFSQQFMNGTDILKNSGFVNGLWVKAKNGSTFDVYNPATGKIITEVPNMDVGDGELAIKAASIAFIEWSSKSAKERSSYIRKWYNVVSDFAESIAEILSSESGKPYKEALGEVTYGNSFLEWFSEEARRVQGEVLSSPVSSKELMHIKQPVGVAGLITPWNFPMAMITRKAGAALAAGCTCIIKPAEDTPLTALALAYCAERAGIPPGVINVLTCERRSAALIGELLCNSPSIAAISFTGSTAVGKLLYKQCSTTVKRLALELGGNAPFIVFKNADLDKAVEGATASKFRNAGQTCVSANRFLVEDAIYDEFVDKLTKNVRENVTLEPSEKSPGQLQIGPLINNAQLMKVDNIVGDAIKKGALLYSGGKRASHYGELYYEPTILGGIKQDMLCYNEEIFGPVIPCIRFNNEEEAIRIANETNSGLAGYFFSSDVSQIFRVARHLQVGMVGINEGIISTAEAAFGGIKESGLGREGSHYGIDEFLFVKYLCFGNLQK